MRFERRLHDCDAFDIYLKPTGKELKTPRCISRRPYSCTHVILIAGVVEVRI
jgi:hypothetical protein